MAGGHAQIRTGPSWTCATERPSCQHYEALPAFFIYVYILNFPFHPKVGHYPSLHTPYCYWNREADQTIYEGINNCCPCIAYPNMYSVKAD